MLAARLFAWIGLALMSLSIAYPVISGADLTAEGSTILALAWGKTLLVDVYLGFVLVIFWISVRESSWSSKFGWGLGVLIFGNLVTCLYLLAAIKTCGGDLPTLLLGRNATRQDSA